MLVINEVRHWKAVKYFQNVVRAQFGSLSDISYRSHLKSESHKYQSQVLIFNYRAKHLSPK